MSVAVMPRLRLHSLLSCIPGMESEWEALPEEGTGADEPIRLPSGAASVTSGTQSHDGSSSKGHGRTLTKPLLMKVLAAKLGPRQHDQQALAKQLGRQTHLHLHNMHLNHLGDALTGLKALETLYLYDNLLEECTGLSSLPSLTCLYLQNNLLTQHALSDLTTCTKLTKLYLQGNHVGCVTGLSSLHRLAELHISGQKLGPGGSLSFDPACLEALASSLQVLSAMDCNLQNDSLQPLALLSRLTKLELGDNALSSFDDVEDVLRALPVLRTLDLRGNPMCRQPRYRESVVVMSDTVTELDGEVINMNQRQVLMRLQIKRMKAQLAADMQQQQQQDRIGTGPSQD